MKPEQSREALCAVVMALDDRERIGPHHIADLTLIAAVERVNGHRLIWCEAVSFARGVRAAMGHAERKRNDADN